MGDVKKKDTVLSIVSFRYSIIVSFSIFTILFHALLLQSFNFINKWLPRIKDAVKIQEESGIQLQIQLNAEEISAAFEQSSLFFEIMHNYGENVFQRKLPVNHFYQSFHEHDGQVIVATENVPVSFLQEGVLTAKSTIQESDSIVGISSLEINDSLRYSIWYNNNASLYTDNSTPYVLNSTILDNLFRALYGSYPLCTSVYAGMDNGVLRVYPQGRLESDFLKPHQELDDTADTYYKQHRHVFEFESL